MAEEITAEETTLTPEQQAVAEMEGSSAPAADGPPPPPPRLLDKYRHEVVPKLQEEFHYSSPMELPTIAKVTLSMGLG